MGVTELGWYLFCRHIFKSKFPAPNFIRFLFALSISRRANITAKPEALDCCTVVLTESAPWDAQERTSGDRSLGLNSPDFGEVPCLSSSICNTVNNKPQRPPQRTSLRPAHARLAPIPLRPASLRYPAARPLPRLPPCPALSAAAG
jgi:hypothetical protein